MPISPRYPHGLHVSVYPTVETMRAAYLQERYLTFPHEARIRIGPVPESEGGLTDSLRAQLAECRPTAHAVVIVPRKIVLLRFARRATLDELARLEYERDMVRCTPELAPARGWPCEARLVYCAIEAGVKEAARERGIKPALFVPRLCLAQRSRRAFAVHSPFVIRGLNRDRVAAYVAENTRLIQARPDQDRHSPLRTARIGQLTAEQRSARTSKAMRTRWSRLKPEARSALNRQRGFRLWGAMTREERVALGRRLNEAKRRKRPSAEISGVDG
jgi:hypothetical protein